MSNLSRSTAKPESGPPGYRTRRARRFPAGCAPQVHAQITGAPPDIYPGYAYIPPGVRAQRPIVNAFLVPGVALALVAHVADRQPPHTAQSVDSTVRLRGRPRVR